MSERITFPFKNWRPSILEWSDRSILHAQTWIEHEFTHEGPVAFCSPAISLEPTSALKIDNDNRPCIICLWKFKKIEQIFGAYDVIDSQGRYEARDRPYSKRYTCPVCHRRRKPGPVSQRVCLGCERYEFRRITDSNRRVKALREA